MVANPQVIPQTSTIAKTKARRIDARGFKSAANSARPRSGQPRRDFARRGCLGMTEAIGKRTCKPNSVVCGHSSRRRVAADAHQRPTRRFRQLLEPPRSIGPMRNASLALGSRFPPYLVLLRVGFTLPPALPPERCALTAPFHPYPGGTGRPGAPEEPFRKPCRSRKTRQG